MKEITIHYTNKDTKEVFTQTFNLSDEAAKKLFDEISAYKGGEIKMDTNMFYLLTSCTYLSKLEGFEKTPNFDIDPPDWMVDPEVDNYKA